MRNQKYYIAIDESERRIILNALNALRNKLLAQDRYTDAVDDVLMQERNYCVYAERKGVESNESISYRMWKIWCPGVGIFGTKKRMTSSS